MCVGVDDVFFLPQADLLFNFYQVSRDGNAVVVSGRAVCILASSAWRLTYLKVVSTNGA
jgi:hypothetical protein